MVDGASRACVLFFWKVAGGLATGAEFDWISKRPWKAAGAIVKKLTAISLYYIVSSKLYLKGRKGEKNASSELQLMSKLNKEDCLYGKSR